METHQIIIGMLNILENLEWQTPYSPKYGETSYYVPRNYFEKTVLKFLVETANTGMYKIQASQYIDDDFIICKY